MARDRHTHTDDRYQYTFRFGYAQWLKYKFGAQELWKIWGPIISWRVPCQPAHTINGSAGPGNARQQFLEAQERRSPLLQPLSTPHGKCNDCDAHNRPPDNSGAHKQQFCYKSTANVNKMFQHYRFISAVATEEGNVRRWNVRRRPVWLCLGVGLLEPPGTPAFWTDCGAIGARRTCDATVNGDECGVVA